jgi:hypothetical protein
VHGNKYSLWGGEGEGGIVTIKELSIGRLLRERILLSDSLRSYSRTRRVKSVWRIAYGLNYTGFESLQVQPVLLSSETSTGALGPSQPSSQCVPLAFSQEIQRPGREADHSNLVSRLWMSRAKSAIPLHALTACMWITLHLFFGVHSLKEVEHLYRIL